MKERCARKYEEKPLRVSENYNKSGWEDQRKKAKTEEAKRENSLRKLSEIKPKAERPVKK
jgi:hypothetical protein